MRRSALAWLENRPCLRDAILWSLPALILAASLHLYIIYNTPLAYWSKDSWSYLKFADELLSLTGFSLEAKRRYVYPIFLFLPHALPGATLWWVKIFQTILSLCSVIAVAYIVRKTFIVWKALIIPATLIYALHPHFIYYTGQVLAEFVSLNLLVFSIAGWAAWVNREKPSPRFSHFLYFFIPFALFMLTKPSHSFVWPGLIAALFISGTWRLLRWPHFTALAALLLVTPTVGAKSQGVRLLYTSAFPLTQVETPMHSEYKNAVADLVKEARGKLSSYAFNDHKYKQFLAYPSRYPRGGPLWAELARSENRELRLELYSALALEGIAHEPHLLMYVALQRVLGTHLKGVDMPRMQGSYLGKRLALDYYYPELSTRRPELLKKLFGLADERVPEPSSLLHQLAPHPESGFDQWITGYGQKFEMLTRFLRVAPSLGSREDLRISDYRPTLLGILLLIGIATASLSPYKNTLGVWVLILATYVLLVFCVGSLNPRFLLPAEPLAYLLVLVPLDLLLRWLGPHFRRRIKTS